MIEEVLFLPAKLIHSNVRLRYWEVEIDYCGEKRTVFGKVSLGYRYGADLTHIIIASTPRSNSRKYGKLEFSRWFETKAGKESAFVYFELSEKDFALDWSKAPVRFLSPSPSLGMWTGSWRVDSRKAALTETPYQGIMIEQGFLCRTLEEAQLANICS